MPKVDTNVNEHISVLNVLRGARLRTADATHLRGFLEEYWPTGSRRLADAYRQHVGVADAGRVLAAPWWRVS